MQLTCPNCAEQVKAENINIQQMVAVCSHCDTIFQFDTPESNKPKRRKIKRPLKLQIVDRDDKLHMAFRTNFRLDTHENFIGSLIGSFAFTFMTLLFGSELLGSGDIPFIFPLGFGLVAFFCYYMVALIAFNKTHIKMNDDKILISRKPLPSIFNHMTEIDLGGVVSIHCEETEISKEKQYDTPRYRVWAEMANGTRKTIVNDVIDDYGYFIAQQLQVRLHHEADYDASRLEDSESTLEDAELLDEIIVQEAEQNHI